jgi:EpsI family protein
MFWRDCCFAAAGDRRELLISGGSFAAAALSVSLKPRRHVSLLGGLPLAEIVPSTIGNWQSKDVSDLLDAKGEGNLMNRIYGQTVERVYRNTRTQTEIMMLLAYGDTQSNDLQLHRPEVCYPAFGLEILANRPIGIPLSAWFRLPARSLLAHSPSRDEAIVYWSRLGDFLPTNGSEQRIDRLRTTLEGYVADGLLARLSMITIDQGESEQKLGSFIAELFSLVPVNRLPALIGMPAARALTRT